MPPRARAAETIPESALAPIKAGIDERKTAKHIDIYEWRYESRGLGF